MRDRLEFFKTIGICIGLACFFLSTGCTNDDDIKSESSELYFPPADSEAEWETISPFELDWELSQLSSLDSFLEQTESRSFLILQKGKIAHEVYFNDDLNGEAFSASSVWPTKGISQSLFAFTFGVFLEKQNYDLGSPSSNLLTNSWSLLSSEEQSSVGFNHHLEYTAGLAVNSLSNDCTDMDCFEFVQKPGELWREHPALYWVLADSMERVYAGGFEAFFDAEIAQHIGLSGNWLKAQYAYDFYTNARSLARLGLLISNDGIWDDFWVLSDEGYREHLKNAAQADNPAFAYHWWLNTGMGGVLPFSGELFEGRFIPSAPSNVRFAISSDGQLILHWPSKELIIVRQGSLAAGVSYHDYLQELWAELSLLVL